MVCLSSGHASRSFSLLSDILDSPRLRNDTASWAKGELLRVFQCTSAYFFFRILDTSLLPVIIVGGLPPLPTLSDILENDEHWCFCFGVMKEDRQLL